MNKNKGFKRLMFVFSLIFVLLGIIWAIKGLRDGDRGTITLGLMMGLGGFAVTWIVYAEAIYLNFKGFSANYCENCDRELREDEKEYGFNKRQLCTECRKKLNKGKTDSQ